MEVCVASVDLEKHWICAQSVMTRLLVKVQDLLRLYRQSHTEVTALIAMNAYVDAFPFGALSYLTGISLLGISRPRIVKI